MVSKRRSRPCQFLQSKRQSKGSVGKTPLQLLEVKTKMSQNPTHLINQESTMNEKNAVADVTETGNPSINNATKGSSRRKFLGQVGAALTGGVMLGKASLASAQSDASGGADGVQLPNRVIDPRVKKSFAIRAKTATKKDHIKVPTHTTHGAEERSPDKSGTYPNAILPDGIRLGNLNPAQTFQ